MLVYLLLLLHLKLLLDHVKVLQLLFCVHDRVVHVERLVRRVLVLSVGAHSHRVVQRKLMLVNRVLAGIYLEIGVDLHGSADALLLYLLLAVDNLPISFVRNQRRFVFSLALIV